MVTKQTQTVCDYVMFEAGDVYVVDETLYEGAESDATGCCDSDGD